MNLNLSLTRSSSNLSGIANGGIRAMKKTLLTGVTALLFIMFGLLSLAEKPPLFCPQYPNLRELLAGTDAIMNIHQLPPPYMSQKCGYVPDKDLVIL